MAGKEMQHVQAPILISNGPVSVGYRGVTVTPLSSRTQTSVISKIFLKAMPRSKERKGENEMFTLRNINTTQVSSVSLLVELIRGQLKGGITSEDFEVGYVNGSNLISLRNKEDVSEVWAAANTWFCGVMD